MFTKAPKKKSWFGGKPNENTPKVEEEKKEEDDGFEKVGAPADESFEKIEAPTPKDTSLDDDFEKVEVPGVDEEPATDRTEEGFGTSL